MICPLGADCCKNGQMENDGFRDVKMKGNATYQPFDPSQEPIFPPELQVYTLHKHKCWI